VVTLNQQEAAAPAGRNQPALGFADTPVPVTA
jgi:hypothetical protein